ncbi:MAG: PrsW family intramembrane metalloprotease [Candidatus Ryanbacteria bacterium]|nr:PrsW family intramembrane metalloprotease [Candidatus Ryanbacteria bacterium]
MTIESLLWAFLGSFIPAGIWLFFWLEEDESPEPNYLLLLAFLGGMLAIPAALFFSWAWLKIFPSLLSPDYKLTLQLGLVVGFAFIEEAIKYFFTLRLIFWRKEYDEPADAMVYLITGALGFSAVENLLYLVEPFGLGLSEGFAVSNLRFIGATPLHALSAGILGYFIGRSFFKSRSYKNISLGIGLLVATALHTIFNILILLSGGRQIEPSVMLLLSIGVLVLFGFERLKHKLSKYYAQR